MVAMTRRRALQAGAAALAAPAFVEQANAQSSFDWRRLAFLRLGLLIRKVPLPCATEE